MRGNVEDRTNISKEFFFRTEARVRHHEDPSIFTAGVQKTILQPISFASGLGGGAGDKRSFAILGMNGAEPSGSQPRLLGLASKLVPGLAQEPAAPIGVGDPDHHGSMIRHIAKKRLALPQGFLGLALLGDVNLNIYHTQAVSVGVKQGIRVINNNPARAVRTLDNHLDAVDRTALP